MNRCKICGQPCGIYDICRECQQDIKEGRVLQCNNCGNYYLPGRQCSCQNDFDFHKENSEDNREQKINIEIDNNTKEKTFGDSIKDGFGLGCGCLSFVAISVAVIIAIIVYAVINM